MIRLFIACAAILVAASCGPRGDVASPADPAVHTNQQFGVTYRIPEGWRLLDSDGVEQVRQAGVEAMSNITEEQKKMAAASSRARTMIFTAFEHELNAQSDAFNPSVAVTATPVPSLMPSLTGRKYLEAAANSFSLLGAPVEVIGIIDIARIDGEIFDVMHVRIDVDGFPISQSQYAARHGDHVISIIQTYADDAQQRATERVLQDIKLDW